MRGALLRATGKKHGSAIQVKPLRKKELSDKWEIEGEAPRRLFAQESTVETPLEGLEDDDLGELDTRGSKTMDEVHRNGMSRSGKRNTSWSNIRRRHGRAIMVRSASEERTNDWVIDIDTD